MSLLNDRVYDTIVGKEGVPLDRIRGLFHGSFKSFATPDSPFKGGEKIIAIGLQRALRALSLTLRLFTIMTL